MTHRSIDQLARDAGFSCPPDYNAGRLLWDNLPANADRIAIRHDAGDWTYDALAHEAARIGNHLSAMADPGDRILMFMDDEPAYPAAIMGAMRAGLVPMLINTLSPPDLVRFFLEDSGARAALVSDAFRDSFVDEAIAGTSCKTVLLSSHRAWSDASSELAEHPVTPDDMAFWMYSSGSTGRPKGVVHRHADALYTAETYGADVLRLTPGDVCFSIPKIYFAYGFGNAVSFPMSRGASAVLMDGRPAPERIFKQIACHKPTVLFGLPTLYTALAHSDTADTADLSSVRLCISAAETLSDEVAGKWRERFGLPIIEGLGSTEMLHIYLSNSEDLQKSGSAGKLVPGYDVRLVTAEGVDAGQGEEGVMQVRSLSMLREYWNRPDKNAESLQDGWFITGDRFVMDDDGYYFFLGRADDLVKVSGQWVYPLEIERTLNEHPCVVECCVQAVPLPDKRLTLNAWVTTTDDVVGDDALTKTLQSFAKTQLLPHKYPREVHYLAELPKTGTGKIDRQALRETD